VSEQEVFNVVDEWIAYGGCLGINTFDAVNPQGNCQRLAEFLDPSGAAGQYEFAAATLNYHQTYDARVIYMPYAWHYIYTPGGGSGKLRNPLATRSQMLQEILLYFGHIGTSPITSVPGTGAFSVRNYPNPFNPSTKIEYNLPQRGELAIKIFSLRGELVKVLVDQVCEAGPGFVVWDGTDARGNGAGSGVYFYETTVLGQATVNKMTLVK
jgi:hypothetical protein